MSAEPLIAPAMLRRGPRPDRTSVGSAWLRKGFRPFFALAAGYGALIIPLWLLILNGLVRVPGLRDPLLWHAHEMIFGYTGAVVAGFLLTAVGRWSGKETAVGVPLLALAVLWLIGRIAMLAPLVPTRWAALLDAGFWPALAFAVGRPLVLARNRRNYGILAVVLLLGLANVGTHLDAFGWGGWGRQSYLFALDLLVVLMVVVGARVIPMFTRNALGDTSVRSSATWDRVALALCLASVVAHLAFAETLAYALLSVLAGLALLARARHWGAGRSLRDPMLWILHVGHAFIALGLVLRGAALYVPWLASSATHALAAGAIGSLTVGMMGRVSLGHTGRLIAASRRARLAFVAIVAAGVLRVVAPLALGIYKISLTVAAAFWVLSFCLFLVEYMPVLSQPREDGAPG